jgi:hypothetical protein
VFFVALATDYDGTLARNGCVDPATTALSKEVWSKADLCFTDRDFADLSNVLGI